MLISLNWIRDYVDLAANLDPRELGERFTRTSAEVETVKPISVGASGLIAARVLNVTELPGTRNLRGAVLDVGDGETIETVTAAPVLHAETMVVYAPVGAAVEALGTIRSAKVAGRDSIGMILPGDAIGIAMAAQEAIFLDNTLSPGEPLLAEYFDDWVIEVDNKSITHRPDLWGHYGIAREIAAIYGQPLQPYPVVDLERISDPHRPTVEIKIADPAASPRYSALVVEGVPTQPAPLWMQLRLGHVGMRPISGLVDLTNYIMADLGQPMHAFDAQKVERIEVDWAEAGERFRTLDGTDRQLTKADLMIQAGGKSVALAGIMG
ncbi:MAG: phenylalanine--tRNA ligase beta subunit-related protein, partial [Planctomycetota bacterium]